jgi:hypothetical protein
VSGETKSETEHRCHWCELPLELGEQRFCKASPPDDFCECRCWDETQERIQGLFGLLQTPKEIN